LEMKAVSLALGDPKKLCPYPNSCGLREKQIVIYALSSRI